MTKLNIYFLFFNIYLVLICAVSDNSNNNENTGNYYQSNNNTMEAVMYISDKTLLELSKSFSSTFDNLNNIDNTLNYIKSSYEEDSEGNQLYNDVSNEDSSTLWSSRQRPNDDSKYKSNKTIIEVTRKLNNINKGAGNLRARHLIEIEKDELGDNYNNDDDLMTRRLETSNHNSHIWTSTTTANSIDTLL
jgi:hypothetical protein